MATCGLVQPAQSTGLIGIARMAAESPRVRDRAETEFFAMQARTALNRESSGRMPFAWTLNPYRGCEFGCHYCYARYTHEFMDLSGDEFEKKIFVKKDTSAIFARDIIEHSESLVASSFVLQ